MKSLSILIVVLISSTLSAQVKGYGQIGRTFFTKGDVPGNTTTIGLLRDNSNNIFGVFAEYSTYHSINSTGLSPGIITQSPVSTIAYPYCTGIGYNGDPLDEIKNLGLYPLASSPFNIHIESLIIGLNRPVLKKRTLQIGLSLGCSIGQIEETWKDLELTISNGTNPLVQIPQDFILIQTASAKYIDLGVKSALNCRYIINSKSSLDIQVSNLNFFNSGQMNWNLSIGITSQL